MVGIRGGARRVAYVRGEGGDPLTSLLIIVVYLACGLYCLCSGPQDGRMGLD